MLLATSVLVVAAVVVARTVVVVRVVVVVVVFGFVAGGVIAGVGARVVALVVVAVVATVVGHSGSPTVHVCNSSSEGQGFMPRFWYTERTRCFCEFGESHVAEQGDHPDHL